MSKHDQQTHDQVAHDLSEFEQADPTDGQGDQNMNAAAATVATVAVVAVGALVFEAALIPGIALGVAAMLVPRFLPQIGGALDPLVKSTVRSAYRAGRKTRELVAEAEEHVHDLVAEVNAEDDAKAAAEDAQKRAARDGPSS
jgi:hypothetical protein